MFRFAVAVLAVIGLGSLLFGSAMGLAVGAGFLLLAPLVIAFKILFFIMIFGLMKRAFASRGGCMAPGSWNRRPGREAQDTGPSEADRFAEWHRIQHARDEVDSWVEPGL